MRRGPVDRRGWTRTSTRARGARVRRAAVARAPAAGPDGAPPSPADSLPDVEDEVMCVDLRHGAQRRRGARRPTASASSSARAIAEGMTKDEIKAALVAEYGQDVLARARAATASASRPGSCRSRSSRCLAPRARSLRAALAAPRRRRARRRRRRRAGAQRRRRAAPRRGHAPRTTDDRRRRHHGLRRVRRRASSRSSRPACCRSCPATCRRSPASRSPTSRTGEQRACAASCWPAIIFCLSFTVVFVALGMTATGLGSTLQRQPRARSTRSPAR